MQIMRTLFPICTCVKGLWSCYGAAYTPLSRNVWRAAAGRRQGWMRTGGWCSSWDSPTRRAAAA
eukprot:scaffold71327_cov49-Phaeocystis_antarctica.AAC.2